MKLGDATKALDLMSRALKIKERDYGSDHPQTALALANVAIAHGELGNREARVALLWRAQSILEKAHGSAHPQTVRVKKMIGEIDDTLKMALELIDPEMDDQIWSTPQAPFVDITKSIPRE